MKACHYALVAVGLVLVLGASFLLVPGQRELALMHLKDRDYDAARRLYGSESSVDDLSVSVVVPLTDLYLQHADLGSAVSLMERFVQRHPENLSALRRLDQLYRFSQRTEDVLSNLERISRLDPTEEELRELSNIYNFTSQYAKQIRVLERLVQVQPGNPQNFLDLAFLLASQGRLGEAARTMEAFEARHPRAVTDDTVELRVSLLLDSGRVEEAYQQASRRISAHRDPDAITRFVNLVHFKGQPAAALRLLEPQEDLFLQNPSLLAQLIEIQTTLGQGEKAYARLRALHRAGRLPDDLSPPFINFCLLNKDTATAIEVALQGPLDRLPQWLLLSLADAAVDGSRTDLARGILSGAGEGFLRSHPVAAAGLALTVKDMPAVERWMKVAEERQDPEPAQAVLLAGLYSSLGRTDAALRQLAMVAERAETPDSAMRDLAVLYIDTGQAKKGLPVFASLRRTRPSTVVEVGWALLSAEAGVCPPVAEWLRSGRAPRLSERNLLDLYYAGESAGYPELSVAAAEALRRHRSGRNERLLHARALVASKRWVDAIAELRPLIPGSREEESLYLEALTAAARSGANQAELKRFLASRLSDKRVDLEQRQEVIRNLLELGEHQSALPAAADLARSLGGDWFSLYVDSAVRFGQVEALRGFLVSELERRDLPPTAREERLHVLLDNGGTSEAVRFLRDFADRREPEWFDAYEDALRRLGRRDELNSAWRRRASRTEIPAGERRQIAWRALDAGQKEIAEATFRTLAAGAPAASADVAQLLFLWGPRPPDSALDWLSSRAASATGDELARWMKHLFDSGAASRAVAAAKGKLPRPGSGGPVLDVYLDALAASGERKSLADAIEREASAGTSVPLLHRLARLARESGLSGPARIALERVLSISPQDPDALRQLGVLAYFDSDYSRAQQLLSRHLSASPGDFESNWCYGELLLRAGSTGHARKFFENSLNQVDALSKPGPTERTVRARLLFRLGRNREALAACDRLLAERPGDKALLADLVAAMLDVGLADQAGEYLRRRPQSRPPVAIGSLQRGRQP